WFRSGVEVSWCVRSCVEDGDHVTLRAAWIVVPVRERVGVDKEGERVQRVGELDERELPPAVRLPLECGDEGAEQRPGGRGRVPRLDRGSVSVAAFGVLRPTAPYEVART